MAQTKMSRKRKQVGKKPPLPVQAHSFVSNNLHNTTTTESLGVCLTLDLEDIQGQESNLSDSDKGTSRGVHDGLSGLLSKDVVELVLVVAIQELVDEGLTTKLVNTLHDLVSSGKAKTGEQGSILLQEGSIGGIFEDDLVGGSKTDAHGVTRDEELVGRT